MTGDLGYTQQEVACIDPDMADLAIERSVRRPASGMPPEWVAAGAPASSRPPPPQFTDGSGNKETGAATSFGALDLDEMLYRTGGGAGGNHGGDDYKDAEGRGRRQGTRRNRARASPRPTSESDGGYRREKGWRDVNGDDKREEVEEEDDYLGGDDEYYASGRQRRGSSSQGERRLPRRQKASYYEDDDDRGFYGYERRGEGAETARDDGYLWDGDEVEPPGGRDSGWDGRRAGGGGGGGRVRPRRKLNPAEKYERKLWGDEEDEGQIWTGVGAEGPWPT